MNTAVVELDEPGLNIVFHVPYSEYPYAPATHDCPESGGYAEPGTPKVQVVTIFDREFRRPLLRGPLDPMESPWKVIDELSRLLAERVLGDDVWEEAAKNHWRESSEDHGD